MCGQPCCFNEKMHEKCSIMFSLYKTFKGLTVSEQRPMIIGSIPKLPAQYAGFVLPLFISFFMSGIISMINLWRNVGWSDTFLQIWFSVWMMSWLVAYPAVLIILPLVRRLTALIVDMSTFNPSK